MGLLATHERDNLIAGDFPLVTEGVTILDGQILTRGSLLGRITASGKYILSLSGAGDGSEVPRAIVIDKDVEPSGADEETGVYITGEFAEGEIIFGAGHDADSVRDALREKSIFLKKGAIQT